MSQPDGVVMEYRAIDRTILSHIADSIRERCGIDDPMRPIDMIQRIEQNSRNYAGYIEGTTRLVSHANANTLANTAFYNYYELTDIYLPKCTNYVMNIEEDGSVKHLAFSGCSKLQRVTIGFYDLRGDTFYNARSTITEFVLPTCTHVADNAFVGYSSLQSIYIPLCRSFASGAFKDCVNLECATIGFSTISSDNYPFTKNTKLNELYCPSCVSISDNTFSGKISCTSNTFSVVPNNALQNIAFPECTYIGNNAFLGCASIQNVLFPECVLIGDYAFSYCTSIEAADFSKCTNVGVGAFQNCEKLNRINLPCCRTVGSYAFCGGDFQYGSSTYDGLANNLTSIILPECEVVYNDAFRGCIRLKNAELEKCRRIHNRSFESCNSIKSVLAPACEHVGEIAFKDCTSLEKFEMPNLREISPRAFDGCSALTGIYIPLCSVVGSYAFSGCTSIKEADLNTCKTIESGAFLNCRNLINVSIPDCLSINREAFAGCSNLESISIPDCNYIESYAFSGCTKLQSVYLMSDKVASVGYFAFLNTPITDSTYTGTFGSVFVPASMVSKYKEADVWSDYNERIAAAD